jgi:hypothetical protein
MMQPPPSRYKVVERGRRLEVIDTRTGKPASSSVPLPLAGARGGDGLRRGRDGDLSGPPTPASGRGATTDTAGIDSGIFVTRRWFDDKAPRTIRMNYTNRARLLNLRWGLAIAVALLVALSFLFWPLAIVLVFALVFGPKLRAQLRTVSTRWLDGFDQAA